MGPKFRLPKKPALERPVGFAGGWRPPELGKDFQMARDNPQTNRQLAERFGRIREEAKDAEEWIGNLQLADYRFWVGNRLSASKMARCRCCGQVGLNPINRKAHMEKTKCTSILVLAYSMMVKDRLCVVCDTHTSWTRWGAPLHKGCMESFMFEAAFSLRQDCQLQETVKHVIITDPHVDRPPLVIL